METERLSPLLLAHGRNLLHNAHQNGTRLAKTEAVPADSRRAFNMLQHSGIYGRAAITVKSKTAGRNIMVERAMYWNSRGTGTGTVGGYPDGSLPRE